MYPVGTTSRTKTSLLNNSAASIYRYGPKRTLQARASSADYSRIEQSQVSSIQVPGCAGASLRLTSFRRLSWRTNDHSRSKDRARRTVGPVWGQHARAIGSSGLYCSTLRSTHEIRGRRLRDGHYKQTDRHCWNNHTYRTARPQLPGTMEEMQIEQVQQPIIP